MKVPIYRRTWVRGEMRDEDGDKIFGALLTQTGHRCCLGFLGQACGLSDTEMLTRPCPSDVVDGELFPERLFRSSGHIGTDAYHEPACELSWEQVFAQLNDDDRIDEPAREEWIATGFLLVLGIDVEFVDGEEAGS